MFSQFKRLLVIGFILICASTAWSATTATLPRRVVTLAPNLTESVFALGAGDRVVGISSFCNYPPEAMHLKRCGGEINPNFELLISLKPDLIMVEGEGAKVREFCKNNKIAFLGMTMNSIATIKRDLLKVGDILGVPRNAQALVKQIETELQAIRVDIADDKRPAVFISLSHPEGSVGALLTAGKGTFLDEMVTLAGGHSIFSDRDEPYPRVSKETLIRRRPEIILEFLPGQKVDAKRKTELDSDWAPFASLPAVRNHKIHYLTEDFLLMAGPRLPEIARILRDALHPELKSSK